MNTDDIITESDGSVTTIDAYDGHVEDGHAHGMTDRGYVGVAAILAVMTAAEVSLTYMGLPRAVFLPLLLILMVAKFVTVVGRFMHLKFDNRIFSWLFYSGLLLAVGVYGVALATFKFFTQN